MERVKTAQIAYGLPRRLCVAQVLSGLLASSVALLSAKQAQATATPVDLFDDRAVRSKGFDLIYEAR